MSVTSWVRTAPAGPARRRSVRRTNFRPRLDILEDRSVPSFGWAAAVGGDFGLTSGTSIERPLGNVVATDAAGDVYTAGSFSGSFTPAGSSVPLTSAGGTDVFVTKYSRSGSFLWAVRMGGAANDTGRGIAVGSGGDLFVAGTYRNTATFGSSPLTAPTNDPDAFLAKLDGGTSEVSWARNGIRYSPTRGASGAGVAVDPLGNAYVVVHNFVFWVTVSRVAPDGSLNWQHQYGNAVEANGGIAVTGGSVYVTGNIASGVDLNPGGAGGRLRMGKGDQDGFVLRLSTDGSYVWARQFTTLSSGAICIPKSVAVDAAGNVYTSGSFYGTVDFDPGKGTLKLNSGSSSAGFVTKLNSCGNLVWARQLGAMLGGYSDYQGWFGPGGAMAVDAAGAVYLTTGFTGTVDFNPGAGVFNLTSAGGYDTAVVKLDTNGAFQWAVRTGAAGDDYGTGIAVNGFGEVYVTGRIDAGTADFDPANTYLDSRDLLTGPTGFLWQIVQP
jgi:hypothetical protein